MKEYSVKTLAKIIGAHLEPDARGDVLFAGVSIDSRTTKAGDCFFAIAGENFDGHDYVCEALGKGAVCAVVSKNFKAEKSSGDCILKVDDTIKALGSLAAEYRRTGDFKVVGVTGSVGKTTTRQIIHHVLSQQWRCHQSPKNFNNDIGVPLTLLGAEAEEQIIIAEIASNYPGEIAYLTDIARPDIAIVTNVQPAHLAGFGDMETITEEKLSISQGLADGGCFFINGDCGGLVEACRSKGLEFTTFGTSESCDIRAERITYAGLSSRFIIDGVEIELPLAGPGNVENALAAWCACSRLGVSIDDFAGAVKTMTAVAMRAEPVQIGTLTVLNDCYNANPASMKNALAILGELSLVEKGRPVFICGEMAELGESSEQFHAELGAAIAEAKVQLLVSVGDSAKISAEAAKTNADYNIQTKSFEDTLSACNNLHKFIKDNDIILVKGSRVAGLERAVEKLKELFA